MRKAERAKAWEAGSRKQKVQEWKGRVRRGARARRAAPDLKLKLVHLLQQPARPPARPISGLVIK